MYSIARIIWPLLIRTSRIICTILNCPFNSHPDFRQSCLIQTLTQIALHWHPMLNCPFNSNPDFVQSCLILFSPILHIYVKNFTSTWPIPLCHDPTINFMLDQGSFCGGHWLPQFWASHGFQSQGGTLTCIMYHHLPSVLLMAHQSWPWLG